MQIRTSPYDARFPGTNQARNCYTRYNEYYRCASTFQTLHSFSAASAALLALVWMLSGEILKVMQPVFIMSHAPHASVIYWGPHYKACLVRGQVEDLPELFWPLCRCVAESGEEDDKCKFFQRSYRSVCPGEWVSQNSSLRPALPACASADLLVSGI